MPKKLKKIDRKRQLTANAQQRRRDKMTGEGYKSKRLWVHEDEMDRFNAFAQTLRAHASSNRTKQKPTPLPE